MMIAIGIRYDTYFTLKDISKKTGLTLNEVAERCILHSLKLRYADGDLFEHNGNYFYSDDLTDFPY